MNMRTSIYKYRIAARWLVPLLLAILFVSCKKFLDKGPLDTLSQDNYWENSSQLDMYIVGKYKWVPEISFWNDAVSDNMMGGGYVGGFNAYMNGQTVAPTAAGSGGWSWGAIYEINYFFDNYQKCKDPFDKYKHTLGEACFLKAMLYHNLVKQFGDVPWYSNVISANDQAALTRKRDSRAMVVDSIMALIDKSIELLNTRSVVGVNRINKETALIYKSRVALFEASWAKYHANTPSASSVNATAYFRKVIDAYTQLKTISGNFEGMLYNTGHPASDYFNLFNRENYSGINEVTLSRTYSNNITGASGNGNNWWTTVGYFNRGYTLALVQSFLDKNGQTVDVTDNSKFPKKGAACLTDLKASLDPRFGQSVFVPGDHFNRVLEPNRVYTVCENLGTNYYNATATGYWPKKGNNPDINYNSQAGNPTTSAICFRVAEIMLNYVEAYVELNNSLPDLADNIDRIRVRAGMPLLTGHMPTVDATWPNYGYAVSNLLAIIRNERNTELFGEGYRTDDWKRWRAHALFNTDVTRPRGFKYDPADYDAATNATLSAQLDSKGYYDPWKTVLPNGFRFRPEKDYLAPIPLEDITRSNKALVQNPGWETP
ncbi:RagB/SusD family nutrient uptake outer membrane protein [Chitinophaga rhizosphaerae]|uniref:RagB/SusD family nutrient uptake outer membrane protein n=1 Tax=Chitinophaga rhizosphaerae TaxID=1864947 RepID=UPI00196B92E8|nr:RagB/SusD family nutrient uptake outer membrane protein [Chitinophaga rhizosphaerae]